MRIMYFGLGWVMVALGVIGLVMPLMPGTVFLIIAAACFARSSPRLEAWLLDHPKFGKSLRDWRAAEGELSGLYEIVHNLRHRYPETYVANFDQLFAWHAEGKLRPHVSLTLPMARAADALAMLANRSAVGKIVLTMERT